MPNQRDNAYEREDTAILPDLIRRNQRKESRPIDRIPPRQRRGNEGYSYGNQEQERAAETIQGSDNNATDHCNRNDVDDHHEQEQFLVADPQGELREELDPRHAEDQDLEGTKDHRINS